MVADQLGAVLWDLNRCDESLAMALNDAVNNSTEANWRDNIFKVRKVKYAIKKVLKDDDVLTDKVLTLVQKQHDY